MRAANLSRRAFLGGGTAARSIALFHAGCFAKSGIVCRSCGDACAEAAIVFRPLIGALPFPQLNVSACTGCGACVTACPAGAITLGSPREVSA